MTIIFTDKAKEDIRSIYYFNSQINILFAKSIQRKIFKEINVLKKFPEVGKKEAFLRNMYLQLRALVIAEGKYKVIYAPAKDHITIHVIFDCRRNPKTIE
jgi:Plasmid stabilization system protein